MKPRGPSGTFRAASFLVCLLAGGALSHADESRRFRDWFAFGGEVTGTFGSHDDGNFNDILYDRNNLRLLRIGMSLEVKPNDHFAFLTEVRTDNFDSVEAYAYFLRIHPWLERDFDVQVGRIPPVFGAFARRRYDSDNPLIGYPLGYQYLTNLRPDATPLTTDDFARNRARGSRPYYPVGSYSPRSGLPLVEPLRWDTGIEVRLGSRPLELSAALTQGTLSNPRVEDDNGQKQIAARLAFRPSAALVLGVSASRGGYVANELHEALADSSPGAFYQNALGADFELSRGYWLVRAEGIWTTWDVPVVAQPGVDGPVHAFGVTAESRYKLSPGLFVAARVDHLGFSRVRGESGPFTWDAPLSRVEAGIGYFPARVVLIKAAYQHNWRDGGLPSEQLLAGQISFSFWR